MEKLLDSITTLVSQVSQEKVRSLSTLISSMGDNDNISVLSEWANTIIAQKLLDSLITSWKTVNVSQKELASMIISASHSYHQAKQEEQVELVWTGPSTELVPTRRTEQALLEVIQSSQHELFIVSFVAYEVPPIRDALNEIIKRDVKVSMLVESSIEHGGQVKDDFVTNMKAAIPGASLYIWSEDSKTAAGGGYRIVHAKCTVADDNIAFITSANLTEAALERNMEIGVIVRGKNFPKKLHDHFKALVATRTITAV